MSPSPHACAQPYHLGRNQATMDSISPWLGLLGKAYPIIANGCFCKPWNRQPHSTNAVAVVDNCYAILMRPKKAETAVHDCLIPTRVIWLCACVRWGPHHEDVVMCVYYALSTLFNNVNTPLISYRDWTDFLFFWVLIRILICFFFTA